MANLIAGTGNISEMVGAMKPDPEEKILSAVCPSCGHHGDFTFAGKQNVPPSIAKRMGYDHFNLWHCPNCKSTISEPEILGLVS